MGVAKSYQDGWDKKYCYPESNTLRNLLNIRDTHVLNNYERKVSMYRMALIEKSPIPGNFDLRHLQNIHRGIFSEIYEWAGEIRTVDIAKGNLFCRAGFIPDMAADIFQNLEKENFLIGIPREQFFQRLAYYMGEINAMHPFREGNGRSQREFIKSLAALAGHELNFGPVTREQMIGASRESFDLNYGPMERLLMDNTRKMLYEEQLAHAEKLVTPSGKADRAIKKYMDSIRKIQKQLTQAGFLPTDLLVQDIEKINQVLKKQHSVRDVKEYQKNMGIFDADKRELIENVLHDFKEQERSQTRDRRTPPTPEP